MASTAAGGEYVDLLRALVLAHKERRAFGQPVAILVLTLPFALAIGTAYGQEPVWSGILLVKLVEIALILPPLGRSEKDRCVVVVNFTPQVLRDYRVRVPFAGAWREVLNSDAASSGGSNQGNAGRVTAVVTRNSPELHLVVPPLAAVFLVPEL